MTRLSDERMCAGREFQSLGEDTQKAQEANDDLTQEVTAIVTISGLAKAIPPFAKLHRMFLKRKYIRKPISRNTTTSRYCGFCAA